MKTNIYNYVFLLSILILALSIAQIVEFYQSEAFSVRETYNSSKRNMENLFKKKNRCGQRRNVSIFTSMV